MEMLKLLLRHGRRISFPTLLLLFAGHIVFAIHVIFQMTPNEVSMGFAQKIFYFHLPAAILCYVGFLICFVASIWYLIRPSVRVDVIAQSGAVVGVLFCAMVLLSGPLWALKIWGRAWTGEPRLVLTLALFVIFLAYVIVRGYGGSSPVVRKIGAVLAIFGFADIPLVRYAVQRWGGNHPQVVTAEGGGISSDMALALTESFVAFGLLFLVLFWLRYRVGMLQEDVETLHLELGDRELLLES